MASVSPDVTAINLDRLLQRLEHTLLSIDADANLRNSTYERTKVGANVEYARTLLLRLEHETAGIKIQSRKQALQVDLNAKRDLIKQLNRRLVELNQLDDDTDESSNDDDDDDEEETDVQGARVREFGPARTDTSNGLDTNPPPTDRETILRSRIPGLLPPIQNDTGTSSSSSSALFAGRKPSNPQSSGLQQTETLLSHNRNEQEVLSSSLVALAQSLKQSSISFAQSLESEKSVLSRAEGGLDANALGMEAAERRMGTLRRMTEGQGWWGRMKLYAIVAAMWVAAFLLVFVGPKLRF